MDQYRWNVRWPSAAGWATAAEYRRDGSHIHGPTSLTGSGLAALLGGRWRQVFELFGILEHRRDKWLAALAALRRTGALTDKITGVGALFRNPEAFATHSAWLTIATVS